MNYQIKSFVLGLLFYSAVLPADEFEFDQGSIAHHSLTSSSFELMDIERQTLKDLGLGDSIEDIQNGSLSSVEDFLSEADDHLSKVTAENAKNELRVHYSNDLDEIQDSFDEYIGEIQNEVEDIAKGVEDDAVDLAIGYGLSMTSLTMTAILAPKVLLTCRTKPSAVIYVGTSAVYITRELANTRKFRLSQLAEFERISEFKVDHARTYNQNLDAARYAADLQVELLRSYKNVLRSGFESIQDKAKNAKQVFYGFGIASATAAGEQYFGSGTCGSVSPVESGAYIDYEKFNIEALASADNTFFDLVRNANELSEAMYHYYQWDAQIRGEDFKYELSDFHVFDESYDQWLSQDLLNKELDASFSFQEIIVAAMRSVQEFLISSSYARDYSSEERKQYQSQIKTEKMMISEQLDNRAADFIADIDKIGALLIGGGFNLLLQKFSPGYNKFLNKVASNGVYRSAAFGVHALLAQQASTRLDRASEAFLVRIDRVGDLISRLQDDFHKGTDLMYMTPKTDQKVSELLVKRGYGTDVSLSELSISELKELAREVGDSEKSKSEATLSALEDRIQREIASKQSKESAASEKRVEESEKKVEKNNGDRSNVETRKQRGERFAPDSSYIKNDTYLIRPFVFISNIILQKAHARQSPIGELTRQFPVERSICIGDGRCPPPLFVPLPNDRFNPLNQMIHQHSQYANAVYEKKLNEIAKYDAFVEANYQNPFRFRSHIISNLNTSRARAGMSEIPFDQLLSQFHQEYTTDFENSYRDIPSKLLIPAESNITFANVRRGETSAPNQSMAQHMSLEQKKILESLVQRKREFKAQRDSSRRIASKSSDISQGLNVDGSYIHPVHLSLFDIIHRRYQLKFQSN